ncbi:MAG: hypothetical protein AB7O39_00630 [Flavobacteriaceae bacterium]
MLLHGRSAAALAAAFEREGCIAFTSGPERRDDGKRHIDGPLLPLLRRGWALAVIGLDGAWPKPRRLLASPVPQIALHAAPGIVLPGFRPADQTLRLGHGAGPAALRLWLKDLPRLQAGTVSGDFTDTAGQMAAAWSRLPEFSVSRHWRKP